MKLYLLTQEVNNDYDTYDSCVVAAESEEEARLIHPSSNLGDEWWKDDSEYGPFHCWTAPENVQVTCIGITDTRPKGVVLASFNAG